jgi:hypothetical protein
MIISDSLTKRNVLATDDIDSKVKNLPALFDFIKQDFYQRKYKIEEVNENILQLSSRKFIKREIVSIEDHVESNLINIEISSENVLIPAFSRKWLDDRSLRVKNSVWATLFFLLAILIPILVIGYVQERFVMLRIFGIVLLCSAGLFYILTALLNPLISKRKLKQKNKAIDIINQIKILILDYTNKELSGTICWNCFSEISGNEEACPNCKVELKK